MARPHLIESQIRDVMEEIISHFEIEDEQHTVTIYSHTTGTYETGPVEDGLDELLFQLKALLK